MRCAHVATMSLLSPEIHAELTQLLQALQSADNGIRSQAEDHLQNNWTNTRPEVLLVGLVEQLQGASDTTVRSQYSSPPRTNQYTADNIPNSRRALSPPFYFVA